MFVFQNLSSSAITLFPPAQSLMPYVQFFHCVWRLGAKFFCLCKTQHIEAGDMSPLTVQQLSAGGNSSAVNPNAN